MVIELVILCGVDYLKPAQENDRITQCEYDKAPTRQLHGYTQCCRRSSHTRKQIIYISLAMSFTS